MVVIACNTAHIFQKDIENIINIPILSLIEVTKMFIVEQKIENIFLLASPTTIRTKLIENHLLGTRAKVFTPPKAVHSEVEQVIRDVIACKPITQNRLDHLLEESDGQVLLGCTELSVAFRNHEENMIDPLNLITTEIFNILGGNNGN